MCLGAGMQMLDFVVFTFSKTSNCYVTCTVGPAYKVKKSHLNLLNHLMNNCCFPMLC